MAPASNRAPRPQAGRQEAPQRRKHPGVLGDLTGVARRPAPAPQAEVDLQHTCVKRKERDPRHIEARRPADAEGRETTAVKSHPLPHSPVRYDRRWSWRNYEGCQGGLMGYYQRRSWRRKEKYEQWTGVTKTNHTTR